MSQERGCGLADHSDGIAHVDGLLADPFTLAEEGYLAIPERLGWA